MPILPALQYRPWIAALLLGLAACGGGGGNSDSTPAFGSLSFSTKQNTDLAGQLPATDGDNDTLTFTQNGSPSNGTLVSFDASGAFVYRPNTGFLGDDSFAVQVRDRDGNATTGTVTINVHPNRAPTAVADVTRADGADLASIAVLTNDSDADGDTLTVTIEEAPLVGSAAVNANRTVSVTGLPTDFKGVTRFRYRITDTSGAWTTAAAAVFVGVEPFRAVFALDPQQNGGYEVYLSDFAAAPVALTSASEGDLRLQGFVASENGATIAYRRESQSAPGTMDLTVVRTSAPEQEIPVPLPAGATLPLDAGKEQFVLSPNGEWLALIVRVSGVDAAYVFNVTNAGTLTNVSPSGAVFASRLRFSADSRNIYLLASTVAGGAAKTLYTTTPGTPTLTVPVSAVSDAAASEDVIDYAVAPDQTAIVVHAERASGAGLFYIDARQLQSETRISRSLALGETIADSTLSPAGGAIGATQLARVGYTIRSVGLIDSVHVADASATPSSRELATSAGVIGLRPDEAALAFARSGQIYERDLSTGGAEALVAAGGNAWYDSTGNIVLVQQAQFVGLTPYTVLAVTIRGSFGSTRTLGTPAHAARLIDTSGFDRGVVILGESSPGGAAPTRIRLALVNALAPEELFYLSEGESPMDTVLTSAASYVVGR